MLSDVRGAPTPEDLVQDAVTDVLTGRRSRPEGVPLVVLLYGVMRSRASQIVARSKTTGRASGPRFVDMEAAARHHAEVAEDPAQSALVRERVLRIVEGDDVLERMVRLWLDDPSLRARDLAAILELPVAEVYAAARRLRRRDVPRAAFDAEDRP